MQEIIKRSIEKHKEALELLEANGKAIAEIAKLFLSCLERKAKLIFMGNGGSAADASHLAAEFTGRFKKNRKALPALSLSTNIPTLTAIGNDFGFDEIFVRQIESLAKVDDLVVGISTSGNSANVLKAIMKTKKLGIKTVGFLGRDGGKIKDYVDMALIIPSFDTPRIQEMHILVGHIICEIVEEHLT
jgi:D-sedoheptulose 7-phosphate isomerase